MLSGWERSVHALGLTASGVVWEGWIQEGWIWEGWIQEVLCCHLDAAEILVLLAWTSHAATGCASKRGSNGRCQ